MDDLNELFEKDNPETALPELQEAAQRDDTGAMLTLGGLFNGQGKSRLAEYWLTQAAYKGDAKSMRDLAGFLREQGKAPGSGALVYAGRDHGGHQGHVRPGQPGQ